jgi:hypothetical protein
MMTKKRDPKDLPDALAFPPRALHSTYSKRGGAAAAKSQARARRLAALDKEKKHG